MATQKSKAKRKVGTKVAAKKTAKTAVKAEAKKATPRTKYGAPSVRPNRGHTGASRLGDRKWVFQGVMAVEGANNAVSETAQTEATAFPMERAEKILAKALQRKDVINGRLSYRKADGNTQMRSVWIAYEADNGKIKATA